MAGLGRRWRTATGNNEVWRVMVRRRRVLLRRGRGRKGCVSRRSGFIGRVMIAMSITVPNTANTAVMVMTTQGSGSVLCALSTTMSMSTNKSLSLRVKMCGWNVPIW